MEKGINLSLGLLPVFLTGGMIALYFVAKLKYPDLARILPVPAFVFILAITLSAVAVFKKKYLTGLVIFMVSFVAFALPLSGTVLPELIKYKSSKKISERLLALVKPGEIIGAETRYRRGIAFYMDREDILDVHRHDTIIKLLPRKERVWCVMKKKNHLQLYTNTKKPYLRTTYVVDKIGKKVLITNKKPEGIKVLKVVHSKHDTY